MEETLAEYFGNGKGEYSSLLAPVTGMYADFHLWHQLPKLKPTNLQDLQITEHVTLSW
jgi:hypothetical protein